MARRFGGKYSPDTNGDTQPVERGTYDGARADPVGLRANLLFLPPAILVFFSLTDGAIGLSLALLGAAFLTLAAWLLRGGLRAEVEYNARKVARRPVFPRKLAAGVLTGLGIGTAALKTEVMGAMFQTEPGLAAPALFGLVAMLLHLAAFGIDPLKNKGMTGIDTFQQDRVARMVKEAEKYLAEMSQAVSRTNDRKIEARVERFQATARDMFRTVEEDPRDLTAARKYMTVYLLGARDAAIKFADLYSRTPDPAARSDFEKLLDDLEQNFAARTRKMLLDDRSDLTVEIEVLRERLEREGVRMENVD